MPTDYTDLLSARMILPKASVARNGVIRKRQIQFAKQEEQLYAECGARLKNFHSSNLLCICPLLSKPILTRQNIASMIDTQELLALHVSVFRREEIKPPTPVPLTIHFSAALKTLVLGHFFRLHITFAREVCQLFFSLSPIANCLCECDSKSTTSLKNYLIQGFSLQLKIDRLKYWNWLLCGSSRREPSVLKTGRRFCRCYILPC